MTRKTLPQGFDAAAFAKEAKRQYIQIQRSYDDADRAALSSVMTAEMATEIGRELDNRGIHHPTEIVTLDADVLDVSTEDDKYWVSVRFTGLVKEDGEPLPHSIDEVWNLTKPRQGRVGLAACGDLAAGVTAAGGISPRRCFSMRRSGMNHIAATSTYSPHDIQGFTNANAIAAA